MTDYETLLRRVYLTGETRTDRTGTGTRSVFGASMSFDLTENRVALITSKRVAWRKALRELIWMLNGGTALKDLGSAANLWEPWADETGDLGPVYGAQWRGQTTGVDQLQYVVDELRTNPDSRRAVMTAWNPVDLPTMALPPCPMTWQFSLRESGLSLAVYQRSADLFLGVPLDIFEASVLAHMVAHKLGTTAHELHWFGGDTHIYTNHLDAVAVQLQRPAIDSDAQFHLPEDFKLIPVSQTGYRLTGYHPHDAIKALVAV